MVEDNLHMVAVGKACGVAAGTRCNVVDSPSEAVVDLPCGFQCRNLLQRVADSHREVAADTVKTTGQSAFVRWPSPTALPLKHVLWWLLLWEHREDHLQAQQPSKQE